MNRRMFGLLATTSLMALKLERADAQTAKDPALLTTTLTPMGAERAGNADGTIPAWNGGYSTIPAGWQQGQSMPDFFADEQPVMVINARNMADHADRLSEGVQAMMQKYGFSIKIYPTHRTASAPQWVYDNTASNLQTAQLNPAGGRLGFVSGYGGIPFAIPDTSDPLAAGAQIVWNYNSRWSGYAARNVTYGHVVNNGNVSLASKTISHFNYTYYKNPGNLQTFDGLQFKLHTQFTGPDNLVGQELIVWYSTDPYSQPNKTWQLLNGQGRVRLSPEVSFDTPDSFVDGIINFDETNGGFDGSLEKYDWKYVGKKEMYIPYNNNGMVLAPVEEALQANFINPDLVRWELHRVWVVEATLHPGERNVMARRVFYIDEDTWQLGVADLYDSNNSLYHVTHAFNLVRPEVPGLVNNGLSVTHNMQTNDYTTPNSQWNEKADPSIQFFSSLPDSIFDPQAMAASAQY